MNKRRNYHSKLLLFGEYSLMEGSQALGMSTVAEGIETAEEERFLQDAGCHYAQGYRYAKPLPAEKLEELLAAGGVLTPGG